MKTYINLSIAAVALAATSLSYAGAPATTQQGVTTTGSLAKTGRINYIEPIVVKAPARLTAEQDSRGWTGGEIGNNAPHQERNPSAHPELFQIVR